MILDKLLNDYDLWLWDFDDTLINTITYYIKSMDTDDILKRSNKELAIEIPNWHFFVKFIYYLVKNGKHVGIVSFGTYRIIKAYMDRIFGINQKLFTKNNIIALCRDKNDRPIEDIPRNKNVFIHRLMNLYRIKNYKKVILFDDNSTNIADASYIGITSVKIKGRNPQDINNKGNFFSQTTIKNITNQLYNNKSSNKQNNIINNNIFSSIGSRKVGLLNKINKHEMGKILEGFSCPCNNTYRNFFIIIIVSIIIFWLIIRFT